jgi:hypothetical protein
MVRLPGSVALGPLARRPMDRRPVGPMQGVGDINQRRVLFILAKVYDSRRGGPGQPDAVMAASVERPRDVAGTPCFRSRHVTSNGR